MKPTILFKKFLNLFKEGSKEKSGRNSSGHVSREAPELKDYQQSCANTAARCLTRELPHNGARRKPPTYIPTGMPAYIAATLNTGVESPQEMKAASNTPLVSKVEASLMTSVNKAGLASCSFDKSGPHSSEADAISLLDAFGIPAEAKDWILAHRVRFSLADSRVLDAESGGNDRIAIETDPQLFVMLLDSVCSQRDLSQAVQKNILESKVVGENIEQHSIEIEHVRSQKPEGRDALPNPLLESLLKERTALQREQEKLRMQNEAWILMQYEERLPLFNLLDEMFVSSHVLPDAASTQAGHPKPPVEVEPPVTVTKKTLSGEATGGPEAKVVQRTSHGQNQTLHHKADMSDLQAAKNDVQDNNQVIETKPRSKCASELHYNFSGATAALWASQLHFDKREETFEQEAHDRRMKSAAGEDRETREEMDLRHFVETQQMTRNILNKEEKIAECKAALLAAGLQPRGSDISSGFVDDVDDGYIISREDDDSAFVDVPRVAKWLEAMPDQLEPPPSDLDGVPFPTGDANWETKSVEMCESLSMVAEGPEKRRVEKWKRMCGLMGHK